MTATYNHADIDTIPLPVAVPPTRPLPADPHFPWFTRHYTWPALRTARDYAEAAADALGITPDLIRVATEQADGLRIQTRTRPTAAALAANLSLTPVARDDTTSQWAGPYLGVHVTVIHHDTGERPL